MAKIREEIIKRLTEEQKDKVVEMYKAGKEWKEIEETVGVSNPTISYILQAEGVEVHRNKDASERKAKRLEYLRKWLGDMTHKYDVSPMTIRNDLTTIIHESR